VVKSISFEQVFNSTSNGVIVADTQGYIRLINPQAEQILNLQREEVISTNIYEVLPLTDRLIKKCLETGEPQLGNHIHLKNVRLVANITPIRESGQVLGAVCNFQKLKQFENSAQQLDSYKRLNRQLEAIFESSFDGIWVCDNKGQVIDVNRASESLNGVEASDIIGKNVSELVARGLFDRSVTLEVLETKRQVSMMQYVKSTQKYLLVTGTPAFDESGNIYLVVVNERDITQLNVIREELEQSRMEAQRFKDELSELNTLELQKHQMVVASEKMRHILRVAFKLARIEASNILILGESGTGKGLLAKFIHKSSRRGSKPFVQINCAALPEHLLEAELFGYEKGAFTGANELGKIGLFELAQEGTLFLDEIGDLPLELQAKLLKYLDDHEIVRLGSIRPRKVDCTVIAATNRNLEVLTSSGKFRQDLFYRLSAFTLKIPPIRERPEDICELVSYYLSEYNKKYGQHRRISAKTLEALESCPFRGNVRELKNLIKKAVVISDEDSLDDFVVKSMKRVEKRPFRSGTNSVTELKLNVKLDALEKEILKEAIPRCKSTRDMAQFLGISQPSVVRKIRKYGLSHNRFNNASDKL
jgi:PAS domain S-box-containing protein